MTADAPELRVYMRHVRAARLCHGGARAWCAANGISWADMLADGLPAALLTATGDPIVARVVAEAQKERDA